ncbi:MAG TPA: hypothetical protein ENK86_03550 [Campylobacterales bacterium]|nr:hypothetical protein [Campylobacterales bacterium]
MDAIINALSKALHSEHPLQEALKDDSEHTWHPNYPVAIVHEKHRIKEENIIGALESAELFLPDDVTPTHYNEMMIDFFRNNAPHYLKQLSWMCLEKQRHSSYTFYEKRPHDYWKKVQNPGDFQAAVEYSIYTQPQDICSIESDLRDILRRNKEVPSLKEIPFIWIAKTPSSEDIRRLLEHYFLDKYQMILHGEQVIYIGWNTKLQDVNMRHFVCPPN